MPQESLRIGTVYGQEIAVIRGSGLRQRKEGIEIQVIPGQTQITIDHQQSAARRLSGHSAWNRGELEGGVSAEVVRDEGNKDRRVKFYRSQETMHLSRKRSDSDPYETGRNYWAMPEGTRFKIRRKSPEEKRKRHL